MPVNLLDFLRLHAREEIEAIVVKLKGVFPATKFRFPPSGFLFIQYCVLFHLAIINLPFCSSNVKELKISSNRRCCVEFHKAINEFKAEVSSALVDMSGIGAPLPVSPKDRELFELMLSVLQRHCLLIRRI